MKTFILIGYIFSLLIFFIMGTLIVRHTIKYSYLSPRFKNIVFIFGLIAFGIIIFSLVLMFNLYGGLSDAANVPIVPTGSSSGINF